MPLADIPLKSASNLRDLGGWPTLDGRRVRTGRVFRAAALAPLCADDEAVIAALGLRAVVDFRGTRERAHTPVILAGAIGYSLAIEPSVGAGLKDIMRTGQVSGHFSPTDMLALLHEAYTAYALQDFGQYRGLFDLLQTEDNLPLLFHCAAGKDRTGFGAALLLSALGVAWPDVLEDYLATNRFWRRESVRDFNLPPEVREVLLGAHASVLEGAFDALRREYGSLEAYLAGPIGLDAGARLRLAANLLEG
jgi:protein-tyrosine phosphatase